MDARQWAHYSALLDQALELPAAERAAWLARLRSQDAAAADEVENLLRSAVEKGADAPAGADQSDTFLRWYADAARNSTARESGQQFGPWKLQRPLGEGGMGEVWLADRSDGLYQGHAALKFIRAGLAPEQFAARFARERAVLARLNHPGIARLLDAGVTDGLPWLVLEYVDGVPLLAYAESGRLVVAARVRLLIDAAVAVEYAHGRLVVHRDLKPSNLLVTAQGQVKLLDFGIAGLLDGGDGDGDHHLTRLTGSPLTPGYAAPEQIEGEPSSVAADVFALGVLLFQMLSGARPFAPGQTARKVIEHAVLHEEPLTLARALSASDGSHPPDAHQARSLIPVLDKALQKRPEDRYASVAALIDDLQRWLEHRPLKAAVPPWPHRAGLWLRRNRLAAAAAAAVIAALTLGAVGIAQQARVAERERDRALAEASRARTVRDYLVYMFRDAKAAQGDAVTTPLTAEAVLKLAAGRIREQFKDDPAIARDVFLALGDLYYTMQDQTGAAPLLQGFLDLADASTPIELRAEAQLKLAGVEYDRGNDRRAAELMTTARQQLETNPQQHAVLLLQALNMEAQLTREKGDNDGAVKIRQRMLALRTQINGEQHLDTAIEHGYLGDALALARRPDEALQEMQRGWDTLQALGHIDRPDSATYLMTWGRVANAAGDYPLAEAKLRESLALDQRLFPPSASRASALRQLGSALHKQGRLAEAQPVLEEALKLGREYAGAASFVALGTQFALVEVLNARGDYARAKAELTDAEALIRKQFGDGEVMLSRAWMLRAETSIAQRRLDDAQALIARARPMVEGYGIGPNSFKDQLQRISETLAAVKQKTQPPAP